MDLFGAAVLALLAFAYVRGSSRLPAPGMLHPQRKALAIWFWCGWAALAIAFGPPLHDLTEVSFAAHMVQHELMMLVAAPLFVLARPQGVLMWGLRALGSNAVAGVTQSRVVRRVFTFLATPVSAWVLHLVVLWGWHVPGAFDGAATNGAVHWLQHLTFFIAASVFWYSVIAPGRAPQHRAPALISLFTTAVHTSFLAVLLTFATSPWYRSYAAGAYGMTALEDQQLGGLVMWIPGGVVFVAAALAIGAVWLNAPERSGS